MKKKIILGISIIIFLTMLYLMFFWIQNIVLTNSFVKYNEGQGKDSFVRCNWDILHPEFASIYHFGDKIRISFKKVDNIFLVSDKEWMDSYIGGTTVKNSTFPQILKMVKEDCYQFQKTFYQGDDNKLYWTYTKKIEKRIKTKEEIGEEKKREIERQKKIESGEIKVDTRSLEEILEEIKNED